MSAACPWPLCSLVKTTVREPSERMVRAEAEAARRATAVEVMNFILSRILRLCLDSG